MEMVEDNKRLTRADLWTGIVFILLGLAVVYAAWAMPRLESRGVHPFAAPGVVPLLLGGLLTLCGSLLGWRALRGGALHRLPAEQSMRYLLGMVETRRLLVMVALTLGYTLILIGLVPFWTATALYVFVSIVVFEHFLSETPRPLARCASLAALQAVLVALVVTVVFQAGFLVRLP